MKLLPRNALLLLGFTLAPTPHASAQQTQVFTRNYNNQRTGANLSEAILKPSNVNANQFGKLFVLPVDDQIYAGLLYAANVAIGGAKHNVLYAATVNNTVYAFDADQPRPPLSQPDFYRAGRPTRNTEDVPRFRCGYREFVCHIPI